MPVTFCDVCDRPLEGCVAECALKPPKTGPVDLAFALIIVIWEIPIGLNAL